VRYPKRQTKLVRNYMNEIVVNKRLENENRTVPSVLFGTP